MKLKNKIIKPYVIKADGGGRFGLGLACRRQLNKRLPTIEVQIWESQEKVFETLNCSRCQKTQHDELDGGGDGGEMKAPTFTLEK